MGKEKQISIHIIFIQEYACSIQAMMELFILSFIFFVFCYVQVEVITTIPGLNSSLSPESPPVYYTTHLDVVTFIQPHIVKQLVREGSLSALSLHTLIDRDNVVAVLPSDPYHHGIPICS